MGERAAYACVEVGEARLADVARMRSDWTVAQGGSPDPGFEEELRDWWARESAHRRAWVALAAGDGEPAPTGPHRDAVGMANLMLFERMPRPGRDAGRWAYVANVWVDPGHRSRGVGRLLVTTALDWCRAQGLVRVVLNPSEMSVPLYTSLGFRPADDLMRVDL
ncbi:GNAT family N-acetyltransferase [Phycicoccus sp. 3266]|uniref:GNAT family N-acetyltransferase n=1 Tax=Phycicoccus sp. 3266 TaxID=2817751 RepID=UPI0028606544|nr:GNAT family N-acetyltransferase [Phycicoccus sp. 3266]MDR6864411.1 GNAT superfamily N-acetyltransferase [Phycicoccus sp. 3266]